jgi:hypothetical protein
MLHAERGCFHLVLAQLKLGVQLLGIEFPKSMSILRVGRVSNTYPAELPNEVTRQKALDMLLSCSRR